MRRNGRNPKDSLCLRFVVTGKKSRLESIEKILHRSETIQLCIILQYGKNFICDNIFIWLTDLEITLKSVLFIYLFVVYGPY